jgi:hypothetical protein
MNTEKVIFGFLVFLAMALNVVFVSGDSTQPEVHRVWLLFAAVVVNVVATVVKLGDRSQIGALLLAAAFVADLLLLVAGLIWAFADSSASLAPGTEVTIVSFVTGALVANVISAILLVSETIVSGR